MTCQATSPRRVIIGRTATIIGPVKMVFLMYYSCKPKVERNIIGDLNPGTFSERGHFGQEQISRTFWHGSNASVDVSERMNYLGPVFPVPCLFLPDFSNRMTFGVSDAKWKKSLSSQPIILLGCRVYVSDRSCIYQDGQAVKPKFPFYTLLSCSSGHQLCRF